MVKLAGSCRRGNSLSDSARPMANMTMIDHQVGEIMRCLEERGYLDNAVVVFTSVIVGMLMVLLAGLRADLKTRRMLRPSRSI